MPAGSAQARELERFFASTQTAKEKPEMRLTCQVIPYPTRLSYGFQNWTGYDINIEVRQFADGGRDRPVFTALRVTPEGGKPVYLYGKALLPRKVPPEFWTMKSVQLNLGGGFVVGEGKYAVSLWLMDGRGRTCNRDWKINAKSHGVPLQIRSGEVGESGLEGWKGLKGGKGTVTIYMHAAPVMRRRIVTRLSAWDRAALMNSLRSLLEVGGFAKARVRVFNFDGRRIIFESEEFSAADYEHLNEELMALNLGTVSVQTLKGPSEEQFLTEIMRQAPTRDESDAVVFLGPAWRWGSRLSPELREIRGQFPSTYYLALTPMFSTAIDLIERFVKAGPHGKVMDVYQPTDLAKALKEIRDRHN